MAGEKLVSTAKNTNFMKSAIGATNSRDPTIPIELKMPSADQDAAGCKSQEPEVGDRSHEGGPKLPVCESAELVCAVRF